LGPGIGAPFGAIDIPRPDRLEVLHVCTGTEPAARAGDDDRADLGVGGALLEQVEVGAAELRRPRVQAVGPIEGE